MTSPNPFPEASIAFSTSFPPSICSQAADCSPLGVSETSSLARPSNSLLSGNRVRDTTLLMPMDLASMRTESTLFSPLISSTISFSGGVGTFQHLHCDFDALLVYDYLLQSPDHESRVGMLKDVPPKRYPHRSRLHRRVSQS